MTDSQVVDCCVIGSGPAGHTAGIYLGRALLHPVLFEGFMAAGIAAGGQLTTTTDIENYPGYASINGSELMDKMRAQNEACGCRIITETVSKLDLSSRPFTITSEDGTVIRARSVIIATGAIARRLGVPGEDRLWQHGISACAVCDGGLPIFRNKPVVVIGGGDTAMEEALHLTKYASQVILVHRRNEFRASKVMAERVLSHPKIKVIWDSVLVSANGEKLLESVTLKNVKTNEESVVPANGLFYAIGHAPNTEFVKGQVELDAAGYIIKKEHTMTSVPGVFAAGDVCDARYRQAIVAAGSGAMAALDCEKWLQENQ